MADSSESCACNSMRALVGLRGEAVLPDLVSQCRLEVPVRQVVIGLPLPQYSVEIIPVKCLFHNLLNYHQGIRIEPMEPLFFEGMEDFHIGKVLEVVGLLLKWNSVSEGSLR